MSEPCLMRRPVLDAVSRQSSDVRLLAYDAAEAAQEWPGRVEPRTAAVITTATMAEACGGCDAVIQLTMPTRRAADGHDMCIDVDRLHRLVGAIARAGVRRLVSLSWASSRAPAESQQNHDGHSTNDAFEAEAAIRTFPYEWTIIRPGFVYGPGDPIMSALLMVIRAVPAVPLLADGAHRLQPLWHGDLAEVLAHSVELHRDVTRQTVPVAGPVTITVQQLCDQLVQLIGGQSARIPVPESIANIVSQVLTAHEDRPHDAEASANVSRAFGVSLTPLIEGLTRLIREETKTPFDESLGND